jgi:hypothetical protein
MPLHVAADDDDAQGFVVLGGLAGGGGMAVERRLAGGATGGDRSAFIRDELIDDPPAVAPSEAEDIRRGLAAYAASIATTCALRASRLFCSGTRGATVSN